MIHEEVNSQLEPQGLPPTTAAQWVVPLQRLPVCRKLVSRHPPPHSSVFAVKPVQEVEITSEFMEEDVEVVGELPSLSHAVIAS